MIGESLTWWRRPDPGWKIRLKSRPLDIVFASALYLSLRAFSRQVRVKSGKGRSPTDQCTG